MNNKLYKCVIAASLGLGLASCKLAVIVDEGGTVLSQSGLNDCIGPNYCSITIEDENFSETFTAVASDGYEFIKWQDGTGFQCANSTSITCTVEVPSGPNSGLIVESAETASVRPLFKDLGADFDGDGIRDSIDPDDDNDGVNDEFDPDPYDPDVPAITPCGQVPSHVELTDPLDWANQGSQTLIGLGQGVKSTAFVTTTGTTYGGQISVASTTGNSGVQRRVWISECPGGPALEDPKCEDYGTSSTVVSWYQGSQLSSYCNLVPSTPYFINHQNIDCGSASCNVYRNMYNNGNP